MTNRRRRLLILTLCIVACHTIFTAYWFVMDEPNSEQLIVDGEEEANIQADNNQLQIQLNMESSFLPLTPNPLTVMQWVDTSIPWYFKGGTIRPKNAKVFPSTGIRSSRVWPEERINDDRVEEQLMFVPSRYQYENSPIKTILLFNYFDNWMVKVGQSEFISKDCPVNRCTITSAKSEAPEVDAIIFRNKFSNPGHGKSDKQVWILSVLKSAYYTELYVPKGMINWTATYRHDSDISMPYGRWAYYDPRVTQVTQLNQNYARNKTRQVAMFVSNCYTDNDRILYAKELNNYISVDIYGKCGIIIDKIGSDSYVQMLDQDYKFYLAFENSNCVDYVTEKFFFDGLQHSVLPIVMGGRQEDYERMAPERSYIHVDDYESPERLAEYLHRLDTNDVLYNEYFRWKDTGEFIDTRFFCRLCAMLHDGDAPVKRYRDLNDWWAGPGVCDYSSASTQIPPPPTANEQDHGRP